MIQALHNAGIGVIMDVVYNHTYTSDSWLQRTVPNYYYRMNNDGTFQTVRAVQTIQQANILCSESI